MTTTAISDQVRQLNALAAGLCYDAQIQVEASLTPQWAYDPVRRVIQVSAQDLAEQGTGYCAGILAHEAGHALISRYSLFTPPEHSPVAQHSALTERALHQLLNAIEDPRVECWMAQRYPGCRDWFGEVDRVTVLRPEPQPAGLPHFLRFALECAREWALGWQAAAPAFAIPPDIAAALAVTRTDRRRYAEDTLPPTSLDAHDLDPAGFETYPQQIWPRLLAPIRIRAWPGRWEQGVQHHAWQAAELAYRHIVPTALRLLEGDVARLATGLRADRTAWRQARAIREQSDSAAASQLVLTVLAAHPEASATEIHPDGQRLAADLLNLMLAQNDQRQRIDSTLLPPGELADPLPPGPRTRVRLPPVADDYERARLRIAAQIDALTTQIEYILQPRRRLHDRAGYPSGYRIDLRRVMDFAADARRYHQLWRRKSIPDRHDTAVFLLVDLSGSMQGPKSEAALLGTVLVAETLHRLGVPLAVAGFQDELIPFLDFHDPLDAERRQRLETMPQEVNDSRPDGHNHSRYNDDGPCVLEAAERLLAQAAHDRILMVISDGLPEGRRSDENDLRRAIATLCEEPGLSLIGIGLGPQTEHVTQYYPDAVANVPVPELAAQLGELLERVLVGGMAEVG